jgi:hypothetical protein
MFLARPVSMATTIRAIKGDKRSRAMSNSSSSTALMSIEIETSIFTKTF